MLIIKKKENESIEKALRRYKNKVRNVKLHDEVKNRRFFEKDSVKKRNAILKAAYKNRKAQIEAN
ncbi:30S ribosomal protein S21 [Flexithrix dorotheae]|uniref:30S ribosomal protein S21 n=1 Tax=Flexithrix dorotheae TaxID=70993 RepID=UPI00035CB49D|nr:30S ribosomal protein S21 [Flexithrix dorotheae]